MKYKKFRSAYDRGETTYSEQGSPLQPVYGYQINKKTGKKEIVKTGETNIYEMIQASAESCKLQNIIAQCNGDYNALMAEGNFIDVSEMPTSLMEMQNLILKTTDEFEKLPAEVKKKFENSVEKYISLYGTQEWGEALGLITKNEEGGKLENESGTKKLVGESD